MIKFSDYLVEQKNTHMEHAEEEVLNLGVEGTRNSINALRAVRDMLAGNSSKKVDITTKWDGAPAVFAGQDPRDGKFFVAKKGIFNKNPKVYKTYAEIDADTSGDLAEKLKVCLMWLPKIGIRGVLQGDLLFTQADLKSVTIDEEEYITFHPNTIVYAVPKNSDLAKQIQQAKLGIVWHTVYEGNAFEDMKAVFGKDILSMLKKDKSVWSTDVNYRDVSGKASMTEAETNHVTELLSQAGKIFQQLDAATLNAIKDDEELLQRIKTFNNTKIRARVQIVNVQKHVSELIDYINDIYTKEAEAKKTEKGKLSAEIKRKRLLSFFTKKNKKHLEDIFEMMNLLAAAKLILVKKLDEVKSIGTFLMTKNGYEVTGAEGYVAIDKLKGNAVKLVDRLQFSYANFSPDIIKGWQR